MTIIINVRHYSGSFIARGQGFKPTASNQRSAADAAYRLAQRLSDGRLFELKHVTNLTYLCEIEDSVASAVSADKNPDSYRVGKREGQHLWQIKQAPGWGTAAEFATIREVAHWLANRGIDTAKVPVISVPNHPSVADYLRDLETPV